MIVSKRPEGGWHLEPECPLDDEFLDLLRLPGQELTIVEQHVLQVGKKKFVALVPKEE